MMTKNVCTDYFFMDATASVKLDNKSLFNKKKTSPREFRWEIRKKLNTGNLVLYKVWPIRDI